MCLDWRNKRYLYLSCIELDVERNWSQPRHFFLSHNKFEVLKTLNACPIARKENLKRHSDADMKKLSHISKLLVIRDHDQEANLP